MTPENVPDEVIAVAVRANADRNHADLCGCTTWPGWCTSDYSPTQWEHGDEAVTIAAAWPEIERTVREQIASEFEADADAVEENSAPHPTTATHVSTLRAAARAPRGETR